MHFRTLAAEVAFLDVFLCIVPRTACVSHEDSKHETGRKTAYKQAKHAGHTEYDTGDNRSDNCEQRRENHLALCAFGRNLHATCIVGLGFSFEDTFNFAELTANLVDHVCGSAAYGIHGKTTEKEGHHCTDKHAGEHFRAHEVHFVIGHEIDKRHFVNMYCAAVAEFEECGAETFETDANFLDIRCEQGKACESCRTDSEAFAGGGSGVAQRIESVGATAHFLTERTHFGITAGVIGDRPVSVGGKSDAECGEHANSGDTDTVETHGDVREIET